MCLLNSEIKCATVISPGAKNLGSRMKSTRVNNKVLHWWQNGKLLSLGSLGNIVALGVSFYNDGHPIRMGAPNSVGKPLSCL